MMALIALLGLVMPFLVGVQGTCDPDAVKNIKAFWNGKPPLNILEQLNGTLTYLTAPGYFTGDQEDIECFQTNFNGDGSAYDVVITHNDDTTANVGYQVTDNGDGTLSLTTSETYKGFAGVGVVNANNSEIEFSPTIVKGLKAADSALKEVKLVPLPAIDTSCGD